MKLFIIGCKIVFKNIFFLGIRGLGIYLLNRLDFYYSYIIDKNNKICLIYEIII